MAAALVFAAAVVAMLLTSGQMSDLRVAIPQLSAAMSWLEGLRFPFDMDHVAFFALVALFLRLVLRRVSWTWLLLGLGGLALVTELLQFWTVGRTPSLMDARDDMVGSVIGLMLGAILSWSAGQATRLLRSSGVLLLARIAQMPNRE